MRRKITEIEQNTVTILWFRDKVDGSSKLSGTRSPSIGDSASTGSASLRRYKGLLTANDEIE